jgi:hypothetical protein
MFGIAKNCHHFNFFDNFSVFNPDEAIRLFLGWISVSVSTVFAGGANAYSAYARLFDQGTE